MTMMSDTMRYRRHREGVRDPDRAHTRGHTHTRIRIRNRGRRLSQGKTMSSTERNENWPP